MPRYFEVNFGKKHKSEDGLRDHELSCEEPIFIGNVQMTGVIDRIDIGTDAFNIIDYKTGSSTIRMRDILEGRSLQLPVYLQIAAKIAEWTSGNRRRSCSRSLS